MAHAKRHNLVYFLPGGEAEGQERVALTLDGDWMITGGIRPNINSARLSYEEFAKINWPLNDLWGDIEFWYSYKPGDTFIPEGEEEPVDAEPDHILNLQFVIQIETEKGKTPDSAGETIPVIYRFQFSDTRHGFIEPRGGILQRGLVNSDTDPTDYDNANTNSALMGSCFTAMGMTGTISSTVDDVESPRNLEWDGAHAPSELAHLLEWTGHVYAQQSTGQSLIIKPATGSLPTIPGDRLAASVTAPAISRKTSAIVIISAPAAEIETWDESAEDAPAWHFVVQDPSTDQWKKVSESTWLGADDATRLLNWRKDFDGFDPDQADRARAQMFRCIQIDLDAYPPVSCQILQQVLRIDAAFDARGPFITSELAMQRSNGAGWYNDEAAVAHAVQVVAGANVMIFDRPLVKLDKANRPDLKPFATPLAQAALLPTFSIEAFDSEIGHRKSTRFGFASSLGTVTAQDEAWATNLLTGYRPNVAIYRAPELAVIHDRGAEADDRDDKEDRAKTLAEAIAIDDALTPRTITIKGFYALELDGRVSSIALSQSECKTTVICDAWNACESRRIR